MIGLSISKMASHWPFPTSPLTGGTTTLNTWNEHFVLKSHSQWDLKPPDFPAFLSQQGFSTALERPDGTVIRSGGKMGDSAGYDAGRCLALGVQRQNSQTVETG
jgi:hypothetical protein